MAFRDNLRETLDYFGMEQKELSAKTGLSLITIENYVKKDSSLPTVDKAVTIAQALGVSVEYLMTGKKTKKDPPPVIPPVDASFYDIRENFHGCYTKGTMNQKFTNGTYNAFNKDIRLKLSALAEKI